MPVWLCLSLSNGLEANSGWIAEIRFRYWERTRKLAIAKLYYNLYMMQHEKLVRFIIIFYIWNQLLKNVLSCKFVICIKQIQSDFTSIWKKKFELESVDQYKINRNTEYHLKWCTGISLLYHCKNVTKSKNYM